MKKLIAIAVVVLGLSSSVHADPITIVITSGILEGTGSESSRVTGTGSSPSGFSFVGGRAFLLGNWGPGICMQPVCAAGTTIDMRSSFTGQEFPGFATYNGVTYEMGRTSGPPSAMMQAMWTASLTIPIDFTGGTLTAPFTFSGAFFYPTSAGERVNLIGSGLFSAEMIPRSGQGPSGERLFGISEAVYTFSEDALAPTPEPGTWLLIGTGAALVARVRRRRPVSAE
jgi:hypothetical protein